MFPRPDFFSGSLLNFAENLLYPSPQPVDEAATAVITATEVEGHLVSTTWAELREAVRRCSDRLRASGLRPNDVVAGFVSNHVEALVAMLSAAAVGAVWTGMSPDSGVSAVLDRLEQITPKVLFADNGTVYNGKPWSSTDKTSDIVTALASKGLETVIVIKNIESGLDLEGLVSKGVVAEEYQSYLQRYLPTQMTLPSTERSTNAGKALQVISSNSSHWPLLTLSMYCTPAAPQACQRPSFTRRWEP